MFAFKLPFFSGCLIKHISICHVVSNKFGLFCWASMRRPTFLFLLFCRKKSLKQSGTLLERARFAQNQSFKHSHSSIGIMAHALHTADQFKFNFNITWFPEHQDCGPVRPSSCIPRPPYPAKVQPGWPRSFLAPQGPCSTTTSVSALNL